MILGVWTFHIQHISISTVLQFSLSAIFFSNLLAWKCSKTDQPQLLFVFANTKDIFSGKVYSKTVIQEGFLYFLFIEAIKLNQYRVTVGMFNNCNSAQCNSYNIWYNHSFRYCSSFILVSVIFIYLHYLFSWRCILAWCWRKSRTCMSLEFGQYFCALLHQIITFKGLCIFSKIWCNLYIWNLS